MSEAIAETRDRKTDFTAGPSWLAEWSGKQIVSRLEREQALFVKAIPDFCWHDSQAETSKIGVMLYAGFWGPRIHYVDVKVEPATENTTRVRRTYDESFSEFCDATSRFPTSLKASEDDEELVDWNSYIAMTPPPRRSWTVKARFRYVGRSKPIQTEEL